HRSFERAPGSSNRDWASIPSVVPHPIDEGAGAGRSFALQLTAGQVARPSRERILDCPQILIQGQLDKAMTGGGFGWSIHRIGGHPVFGYPDPRSRDQLGGSHPSFYESKEQTAGECVPSLFFRLLSW